MIGKFLNFQSYFNILCEKLAAFLDRHFKLRRFWIMFPYCSVDKYFIMPIKILIVTKEGPLPINKSSQWPLEVQRANNEDVVHFLLQEWEPNIVIIDLNKFPIKLVGQIRKQSKDPFLGIIVWGDRLTKKTRTLMFQ